MSPVKNFIEFRYKFLLQRIAWLFKTKPAYESSFLFVSQKGTEEWILGAKARRLSRNFVGDSRVFYSHKFKKLPNASGYFFLHQKYYAKAIRYNPFLKEKTCFVMFTHPEWNKHYSLEQAKFTLQHAAKIICLNQNMVNELVEAGLPAHKLEAWPMASDPEMFPPKPKRNGKTIGFCCAYYERKNPELIMWLVKNMEDVDFILVGKDWHHYPGFKKLLKQKNFTYHKNLAYKDYPALYHKMDVLVSPSFLEGGPAPLLKAMLSNVVPVASRTGYCPDIIEHGVNGYLFDPYATRPEEVANLIYKALQLQGDVRKYVEDYSWKNFGEAIANQFHTLKSNAGYKS